MAGKSRDAFRTISEVADWLDVPTHVLRFWESRFSQIKPVKRAGGRRYYRPSDMRIIGGVKVLLHDQGMTIRGVQKLFREEGLKHVSSFSPRLFGEDDDALEASPPLDEAALEAAARPAPTANATHKAAPDPIPDDRPREDEDDDQDAPRVLFRHTTETPQSADDEDTSLPGDDAGQDAPAETHDAPAPATSDDIPEDHPELSFVPETDEVAEAAPSAPSIPPTPDVPETDPADDDPRHDQGPGLAARLVRRGVAPNADREALQGAASRLKALLDRAS